MKFTIVRGGVACLLGLAMLSLASGCARELGVATSTGAAAAKPSVVATTTQIEDVARVT